MARKTIILKKSFYPIFKDMEIMSFKIEITSNDVTRDITDFCTGAKLNRVCTIGLSNFDIEIDNNGGRYKGIFDTGDAVDIYYNFKAKGDLITRRFRGYIDNVYDSFNISDGVMLKIDGRDAPKGESNVHFGDTHTTLQFTTRNVLDCWFGTTGTQDSHSNYANGILYNTGLILKVYDTSSETWKDYKDLTITEKDTLKELSAYDKTHTQTYEDSSGLTISSGMSGQNDLEFRIYYDGTNSFLMVYPEDTIKNDDEHVSAGQNLEGLGRLGNDTTTEYNRIKEKGKVFGSLLAFRTKQDTTKQDDIWIKDFEEVSNSVTRDSELSSKASARLDELKISPEKGNLNCLMLPTLEPGEKIPLNIPYIYDDYIIVKTFTISFGSDISFSLNLKERETTFDRLFKDRMDENTNVISTDNPNNLRNSIIYDFSDVGETGSALIVTITINEHSITFGRHSLSVDTRDIGTDFILGHPVNGLLGTGTLGASASYVVQYEVTY